MNVGQTRVWSIVMNFTANEERALRLQDALQEMAHNYGYDDAVTVLRPGTRDEAYSDADNGEPDDCACDEGK